MKSKIIDYVIYICVILINITSGFLLNFIFKNENTTNFIMFCCGFIILSSLIVYLICQKLGYQIDIFAYNIEDKKYMILNNIFIGNLFSIPIAMVVSVLL